jgi:hypothetical protein
VNGVCPCCGHEDAETVEWGPWRVVGLPGAEPQVFFDGKRCKAASKRPIALLAAIIRKRGEISLHAAARVATAGSQLSDTTTPVVAHRLRPIVLAISNGQWRLSPAWGGFYNLELI